MKTKFGKRSIPIAAAMTVALALALGVAPATTGAQAYPEKGKTIAFIVANPAGSGVDRTARLLAPFIEKHVGIPVRVINKPGSSGQIGYGEFAKSAPDGYTIGLTNLPVIIQLYLDPNRKATFNRDSFQPLGMNNDEPGAIIVRGDSPFKSTKDLMDVIKRNPETVKAGSSGRGGTDHLFGLLLERLEGGKFRYVHFDGAGQAMVALLGGHVDVVPTTIGLLGSAGKTGQARVLGIANPTRSKLFPDIPTLKEQGYDVTFSVTRIVSMPRGAPKEVVDALSKAVRMAITDAGHVAKAKAAGMEVVYRTPEETNEFWLRREEEIRQLTHAMKM